MSKSTFIIKRKTFANAAAVTKTVQELQNQGFQRASNGLLGNFGNMWNGTQKMVDSKGKEVMAKLSTGQRVGQAAIGIGKVGGVAAGTAAVGAGIAAKKVDDAANGIS